MKPLTFTWNVPEECNGVFLREFLVEKKRVSRSLLTDIKFHGGHLFVNEQPVTVRKVLNQGDEVTVVFPEEKRNEFMKPFPFKLSICYEDDHVLIINKPPGLPSIPSRNEPDVSLAQALLHYYQMNGISSAIHIVTRLDRDTSGLMLVAKHRYAHSLLSQQQIKRTIDRTYTAIVHGTIESGHGTINNPIGRKEGSIIERAIRQDGQEAITHYRVLQRIEGKTVVMVKLETGRTHQIRVHFSNMGFPLVGDTLYGSTSEQINRQALHSSTLRFLHPFTEETMFFQAPLPPDMLSIIE